MILSTENELNYENAMTVTDPEFLELISRPSITKVNCRDNKITSVGLNGVSRFLNEAAWSELNLSVNNINENIDEFCVALENNKSLISLNLSNNPLTDVGVIKIFSALKKHPKIQSLYLSCCQLTNQMLEKAAQLMLENSSLKTLDISKNTLTQDGVSFILYAAELNGVAINLNLKFTGTSEDQSSVDYINAKKKFNPVKPLSTLCLLFLSKKYPTQPNLPNELAEKLNFLKKIYHC